MTKPTLSLTRPLPEPVMAGIPARYELISDPPDRPPSPVELKQGFARADAVICTLSDRIDADLLSHAPRLKIVANYAVGYNNIDLAAFLYLGREGLFKDRFELTKRGYNPQDKLSGF